MRLWDIFRFGRGNDAIDECDPAIEAIADAICANLRALGLYTEAKKYGRSFWEIRASSSAKMITVPDGKEASGVALLLAGKFAPPSLVFEQINSLRPGLGRQMVGAAIAALEENPGVFRQIRVNDLSPRQKDGRRWWEHVAASHSGFDWRITHDEDTTHRPAPRQSPPAATGEEVASSPDFIRKREILEGLVREFGCDPSKVTLSPEKKTFDYLGQSFTSEGEALPDGSIKIYYDPAMSDARMGCCLAHELQHVRYFAVRDAYRAEAADGPLHQIFARFTPELLAAQRGVSNYSNEHWDAWKGDALPALFSMELEEGGSEPINETIAEVAKGLYNWGPDVRINSVWKELHKAINDAYEKMGK